jgi:hypothetical protein
MATITETEKLRKDISVIAILRWLQFAAEIYRSSKNQLVSFFLNVRISTVRLRVCLKQTKLSVGDRPGVFAKITHQQKTCIR